MKPYIYASLISYAAAFLALLIGRIGGRGGIEAASRHIVTAGLIIHTAGLAVRIYYTGHAPMASMYETLVFFGWSTVLVTLIVMLRYRERSPGLITLPVAALALVSALANEKPGGPLTLILRTRWFETHVTASFAAYAMFTLAFSGAVLYLIHDMRGAGDEELKKYQDMARRSVLWGFFFFSASMFAGAVWAYLAWGTYWMWEPKMIWSFIVWFYYAGAMHAYYVRAWRGRALSIATAFGFFVVLFTYLGVSLLMKSSHSF